LPYEKWIFLNVQPVRVDDGRTSVEMISIQEQLYLVWEHFVLTAVQDIIPKITYQLLKCKLSKLVLLEYCYKSMESQSRLTYSNCVIFINRIRVVSHCSIDSLLFSELYYIQLWEWDGRVF